VLIQDFGHEFSILVLIDVDGSVCLGAFVHRPEPVHATLVSGVG
jgi:hypothetical protein